MNFTEHNLTDAVLSRLGGDADPRFKRVMTSLVRHLHDFVREVELTEKEWFSAIEFLTATGHACNELRQEFILLSDTLGVSMLVDAVNHRLPAGATPSTVLGPFHRQHAPAVPMWTDISEGAKGETSFMSGKVTDPAGAPLEGAELDIWQADGVEGLYDVQRPGAPMMGRGRLTTGADGFYAIRTVRPTNYPIPSDGPVGVMLDKMGRHPYRPAHIHARIAKPGFRTLVTHIFVAGDPYLDSDAVFGVKDPLVAHFERHAGGTAPDGSHHNEPFSTVQFDFRIAPDTPAPQ